MATLDKSRSFCTIYGLGIPDGAVYVQDGIRFNGSGEEVGREPEFFPEYATESEEVDATSGDAQETSEKSTRRRRTKAEIEADKAAQEAFEATEVEADIAFSDKLTKSEDATDDADHLI